jgi:hypothetical protein
LSKKDDFDSVDFVGGGVNWCVIDSFDLKSFGCLELARPPGLNLPVSNTVTELIVSPVGFWCCLRWMSNKCRAQLNPAIPPPIIAIEVCFCVCVDLLPSAVVVVLFCLLLSLSLLPRALPPLLLLDEEYFLWTFLFFFLCLFLPSLLLLKESVVASGSTVIINVVVSRVVVPLDHGCDGDILSTDDGRRPGPWLLALPRFLRLDTFDDKAKQ